MARPRGQAGHGVPADLIRVRYELILPLYALRLLVPVA